MNRVHDNDVRSISKLTAQTKIHQFVSWMVLVVCVCVCVCMCVCAGLACENLLLTR